MLKIIYSTYIYLRTLIFLLLASIPAIIIIIIAPSKAHRVGSFLAKCLFKCFCIRFQIHGSFPTDGPYVIMHNHSSFLDMFFLPIVIKGKYTGVVAAKNFRIPIIGQIIKRMKAIPIQRTNRENALRGIEIAQNLLNKGYHIAIFPEGTRTISGKLAQLKKGGFHLAVNTKAKILPVVVKGLFQIKPKTRWTIDNKIKAEMIIEKPIDTINKSVDELIDQVNEFFIKHGLESEKN